MTTSPGLGTCQFFFFLSDFFFCTSLEGCGVATNRETSLWARNLTCDDGHLTIQPTAILDFAFLHLSIVPTLVIRFSEPATPKVAWTVDLYVAHLCSCFFAVQFVPKIVALFPVIRGLCLFLLQPLRCPYRHFFDKLYYDFMKDATLLVVALSWKFFFSLLLCHLHCLDLYHQHFSRIVLDLFRRRKIIQAQHFRLHLLFGRFFTSPFPTYMRLGCIVYLCTIYVKSGKQNYILTQAQFSGSNYVCH